MVKIKYNPIYILCLTLSGIFFSCESHEKTADDAFEGVKEERMIAKASDIINEDKPEKTDVPSPKIQYEKKSEWMIFKQETEKGIGLNQKTIGTLKLNPALNSKTLRKVISLENENADINRQMRDYNAEVILNLEKFRQKINQNLVSIKSELSAIDSLHK